ncbi:SDR family NAD(P)-dependent oxidoreductase [Spirosoma endophyticum]|uniref:NAD(P)-dependent dehydrogenase, short-chain alcohol dehydrogenase family n=1 Tax=Spirosoma endophyticum TaxID=662367 RepID=A0A1I1Q241_9BACT|nr:SDR family oxidoreductase [Spirosoma endophyticum]SFD16214.1 NAD(P)-dependent dehydrogenase, short-chain alcohol dehydrogenase family [Spirosoma endophyticum]
MIRDLLNVAGKNALVTGSSQGIGKAIALALAEFGANVLVHYRSDEKDAQTVADEIQAFGVKSGTVGADLSEPKAADDLFQRATEQFREIDILVINASVQFPKDWDDTTADDFDKQVNANWKSTLLLMQRFAPAMTERNWGRILTIGSVQELKPHPAMIVYAGTKAAVANTVRNLALQLARNGVTVNNLSPGVINTPRTDEPTPAIPEHISQRMSIPIDSEGQPDDIAAMAVILCSNAGRYVTGQTIFVDGGMGL